MGPGDFAVGELHFFQVGEVSVAWILAVVHFVVDGDANLGLHHTLDRAHKANTDGMYNITYDAGLHDWFEFVVNRGTSATAPENVSAELLRVV